MTSSREAPANSGPGPPRRGAADRSAPSGHRLGDVQGLRGVAVLLVVAYHAGLPIPGGFVGVDVFFVISGFVITMLLLRELETHGRIRFRRFYARRVRRLLPALALVLSVTAVLSMVLQSPFGSQQDTAVVGIGASTWLANAALYVVTGDYFDSSAETIPLLHTWSLAVEEQFYLIFPALLAVGYRVGLRRAGRGTRGATTIMIAVVAASLGLALLLSYGPNLPHVAKPEAAAFYSAPSRAWEFGVGGLVALRAHRGVALPRAAAAASGWVGAALLIGSAALISDTAVFPGVAALAPVAGTALLMAAGRTGGSAAGRVLATRSLQVIGDLSYSWYLWHWPFIVFARLLWPDALWATSGAAVVALLAAWASYTYFEQPIRVAGSRPGRTAARLVVVSVLVPVLLHGALYAGASRSWGDPAIAAMARQVDPVPMGYQTGCHSSVPIPDRDLTGCTFEGARGKPEIFLVGDSNAGQYAEAVVDSGRALDQTVVLATMSGCPLIDVVVEHSGRRDEACRTFQTRSTTWLQDHPGSVIVIAAANEAIDDPDVALVDPRTGEAGTDVGTKQRLWAAGLERTLTALKSGGHAVLLVNVLPHLRGADGQWWSPDRCSLPVLRKDVAGCGAETPLPVQDMVQARSVAAEREAAGNAEVGQLDLRAVVCPGSVCRSNRNGSWIYRDGLHISTRESHALAPQFERAVKEVQSATFQP